MKRLAPFITALTCLLYTSCRKDLLHWKQVSRIEVATDARLNRILLLPDGTGAICGGKKYEQAIVLLSKDHGNSWVYHNLPDVAVGLYGLCLSPDNKLYYSGFYGRMAVSDKSGGYFRSIQATVPKYMVGLAFPVVNKGIAISTITSDSGSVIHIDSSGAVQHISYFGFGLNDIQMLNEQVGYITGYGAVMKTINGGYNWDILNAYFDNFTGICCMGLNKAWTCGYNGSIYKTDDGGNNWTRLRNGNDITLPRYHLEDILFTDNEHGFAVGEKGLVIYTDDGGKHWMEFDRFTNDGLLFIARDTDGSFLAGGENGALFRITF